MKVSLENGEEPSGRNDSGADNAIPCARRITRGKHWVKVKNRSQCISKEVTVNRVALVYG
jgi:hypothetical protein